MSTTPTYAAKLSLYPAISSALLSHPGSSATRILLPSAVLPYPWPSLYPHILGMDAYEGAPYSAPRLIFLGGPTQFKPTTAGVKTATLNVGAFAIPMTGTAAAAGSLTFTPSPANFSNTAVGSTSTITITLANSFSQALYTGGLSAYPAGEFDLASGGTCQGTSIPAASGLIVGCYIVGLVCFALGRWIRMGWRPKKTEKNLQSLFTGVLGAHGLLDKSPFAEYLARETERGGWRLYVRMWADLRSSKTLAASLMLLRRYWVMAATYDGVVIALLVWASVIVSCGLGVGGARTIDMWLVFPTALALVIAALACSREAGRYVECQIEDLVASIASDRDREVCHPEAKQ